MGYGIKLKVYGDYACFTRPEMKVERVSYDVMTPSAARGIIEAIYWKPAIRWIVDRIHVINEIKFTNIRRNEISQKIPKGNIKKAMDGKSVELYQVAPDIRQQRAALVLRDVCYIIEAHFEMTDKAGEDDTPQKHYNIALRRMRQGKCYHQPYFGTREFSVKFEHVDGDVEKSFYKGERDLGWMLWDIDFKNDMAAIFYRANMKDGVVDVEELKRKG
ncbi:CRISPR-associated protein, Cas5d family [Peptoclostridium litorale DSM 5388]|uniref:pre-crRNA processing endonuclease n=1 Tax=Peptoclostridium litorale DSM 5388 TaxID=1121324 RepID=A0A069RRE0_PEPLI|nr:type I-C CRISPR-associated protein Cas5c [Peptoclostridium litorale]KDR96752.1 CRISPR-associated protein Cas5 [Peptoclostridium litorale DSM 5388]SIO34817.1 CRISPR-associated protein, Cas5d family [Peptoclostridium litorale DSM 5388]